MMRFLAAILGLALCTIQTGCSNSGSSDMTPQQLHKSCIEVFERKGGPRELGEEMCESMKKACESNPYGEECKKAQRIVEKG